MENVQLNFKYTQEEYVKAARQYLIASKKIGYTGTLLSLIFSICYLFFFSFSLLGLIFFGLAILLAFMSALVYFYIPIRNFKQTAKFHEDYSLTFSVQNIKFKTPTIDSEVQWNLYSEVWENHEFYFLIQAPQIYTLIPKRVFPDTSQISTFNSILLATFKSIKQIK